LRYDACIIGAGADGLAAAAWLAARGLSVIAVERAAQPGGRCATLEFHPGHRASPYADELPAIPAALFRAFDLARRGVILAGERLPGPGDGLREAILARVMADAAGVAPRGLFTRKTPPLPWPGEELAARALSDYGPVSGVPAGGLCDPSLPGSALSLLTGPPGGMPAGGLGRLAEALRAAAEEAGAEISCGLEATDIRRKRGRAVAIALADGSEIAARAFISTLDLKRSFLTLFAWNELPKALVERIAAFRPAPGTARLLLALEAPPETAEPLRHPLPVLCAPLEEAWRAWRSAAIPEHPPAVLRLVSAVDPSLAPDGGATLTVTLSGIPHTPFDGAWTYEKRIRLREAALALVETALPGTAAKVKAAELIVPPDIENRLALSDGDLLGGELSATQMLGFRSFAGFGPECRGPRTPVEGFYLAGPSSALGPLASCASGVAAACAVLADLKAGRLG
jgi:phytoene dehydrogenase-like protein